MKRFIISCPFGNYLEYKNATSTVGTFTLENRAGFWKRLWRILSTVRFYPAMGACSNRLGLPNSGLYNYIYPNGKYEGFDRIISISARKTADWIRMFQMLNFVQFDKIELNISCPNCPSEPDKTDYNELFKYIQDRKLRVILKIPPVGYEAIVIWALSYDIFFYHCTNTLPTPAGGLSGKPLQPLALNACRFVNAQKGTVIGGGGITSWDDVKRFQDAGAEYFAVGSAFFNPFRWGSLYQIADKLAKEYSDA